MSKDDCHFVVISSSTKNNYRVKNVSVIIIYFKLLTLEWIDTDRLNVIKKIMSYNCSVFFQYVIKWVIIRARILRT